ncbi:MAG: regulator [Planctomycetaceae bacterium]|nr:regulator [Planctomycetaceae bacterium]
MRILVGWDIESESDLICMYLGIDDNDVTVAVGGDAFRAEIEGDNQFDIALMSINLPDPDGAFELFAEAIRRRPNMSIVGACDAQEIIRVIRFMTQGMSSYVLRDSGGDYMFMLQAVLESTLEAVTAQREREVAQRLREEVESVRKLQESVIPASIDAPEGYSICARYEPSQIQVVGDKAVTMAGGDYYDVFRLDEKHIVLLVGDASGHGMKAAMSIMTMHTLVRMIRTQSYTETAEFVAAINDHLTEQGVVNDEGGFITMLYAILNTGTCELQWTSAGHPAPMLQDLATGEVTVLGPEDAGGLPLAIMEGIEYDTYTSHLPGNSRLLLCTDGLEEAFPESKPGRHNQFGIDGIIETMKRSVELPLVDAMQALFDDSEAFTEGSGRHDDTSVVFLEYR